MPTSQITMPESIIVTAAWEASQMDKRDLKADLLRFEGIIPLKLRSWRDDAHEQKVHFDLS